MRQNMLRATKSRDLTRACTLWNGAPAAAHVQQALLYSRLSCALRCAIATVKRLEVGPCFGAGAGAGAGSAAETGTAGSARTTEAESLLLPRAAGSGRFSITALRTAALAAATA